MRRVFLLAGLALWFCSCGDDRPGDAGAGTTVKDTANATIVTGGSANTASGSDSANMQNANATGTAVDSGNRQSTTLDSARKQ